MARSGFALSVAGLNPGDPALMPGLELALTPRQQRELATALQQAPQPMEVLRQVRDSLQKRTPVSRILEDLRARNALPVLRQYAAPPQGRATLSPALISLSPNLPPNPPPSDAQRTVRAVRTVAPTPGRS